MTSEIQTQGAVSIIQLPERVMMAEAPELREAILQWIHSGRHRMVLDLRAVRLMDSSGLAVLVSAHKAAADAGGRLVMAQPSEDLQSLIEITQLHRVFEIFDSADRAVQALH